MMEFELCIGLIFKPLRYHLKNLVECNGSLPSIWLSVLSVVEDLLSDKHPKSPSRDAPQEVITDDLKATMNSLANEHLQNAIKGLLSIGVLSADSVTPGDITAKTWESVSRMGVSEGDVEQWKHLAIGIDDIAVDEPQNGETPNGEPQNGETHNGEPQNEEPQNGETQNN